MWKRLVCLMVPAVLYASPSAAEQVLYKETDEGWFIYVEDRSCVAYIDYNKPDGGTLMMRFSARQDEHKTYFSIVSNKWDHLTSHIGDGASIYLDFPEKKSGHGSAAMVIRNPDSRMGYAASGFGIDNLAGDISSTKVLSVSVIREGQSAAQKLVTVPLVGADVAMMHLGQCSEEHFGS